MIIEQVPVVSVERLTSDIYALEFRSERLAHTVGPGQFVNIKTSPGYYPFLRRPFSVAYVDQDILTIIFDIVGEGTRLLSRKKAGERLDVLGPLGHGYSTPAPGTTAVLVGGGLGTAPLPFLSERLRGSEGCAVETFIGARTAELIVTYKIRKPRIATDDGSSGFHGTVVSLLDSWLDSAGKGDVKIYACGPNPMLRALQRMLAGRSIGGEASLECVMACGIGICQGCPVEVVESGRKYNLVCKEGPVFDIHSVSI